MTKLLALLFLAAPLAAQTINPASQITWPRVSGDGAPSGHITCPSATNTPTTATLGTPYTDITGPHFWQCGTAGWFQVDGGSCSIKVNGVSVPCPANMNNTTPVAEAGYVNAKVQKDGSSNVSFEVPASSNNIGMQIPDPLGTQSALIYPTGYSIVNVPNGTSTAQAYGSPAASVTAGGVSITVPQCGGSESTTINYTFTGALAAQAPWINPANVTSVYGITIAGMSATSSLHCAPVRAPFSLPNSFVTVGGVLLANSGIQFPLQSFSGLTAVIGSGINSATASVSLNGSGATSATTTLSVPIVVLRVYDSIDTAPAAINSVQVEPPLQVTNISGNPVLSLDPNFPFSLYTYTVASLPNPSDNQGRLFGVSDSADCVNSVPGNFAICHAAFDVGSNTHVWAPISGTGSSGFPITLGSTSIAALSTTTSLAGLTVNGVTLNAAGSPSLFLNQAGGYTTPAGGGGGLSGQTTNFLPKATSATASTTSSHIDDGATTASHVTISEPTDINDGTGGSGIGYTEGTPKTGSAGVDLLTGDSTSHQLLKNPNNTGAKALVGTSTTAATAAHCAQYAANGYDIADSGSACGSGGGGSATILYLVTGSDICTQINTAVSTLGSAGGIIVLPAGSLTCATTATINQLGISLLGQGPNASNIACTVAGDCILLDPPLFGSGKAVGGTLANFTISGNAASGQNILHTEDMIGYTLHDIFLDGASGTGQSCLFMENVTNWTERNTSWNVQLGPACKNGVHMKHDSGNAHVPGSFGYNNFQLALNPQSGQVGIWMEGNAELYGGNLYVTANNNGGTDFQIDHPFQVFGEQANLSVEATGTIWNVASTAGVHFNGNVNNFGGSTSQGTAFRSNFNIFNQTSTEFLTSVSWTGSFGSLAANNNDNSASNLTLNANCPNLSGAHSCYTTVGIAPTSGNAAYFQFLPSTGQGGAGVLGGSPAIAWDSSQNVFLPALTSVPLAVNGSHQIVAGTASNYVNLGSTVTWTQTGGSGSFASGQFTVATAGSAIAITSIPGTYANLIFSCQGRGSTAATFVNAQVTINADTAGNYDYNYTQTSNAVQQASGFAASNVPLPWTASTATANYPGQFEIVFKNYAGTTFFKEGTFRDGALLSASSANTFTNSGDLWWRSTSAITGLAITASAGNFIAGSTCTLYGTN